MQITAWPYTFITLTLYYFIAVTGALNKHTYALTAYIKLLRQRITFSLPNYFSELVF